MSEFKTITPAGRTIVTNLTTEELITMISELKNKLEWYENEMSNKEDNDGFISLNSMDEYEKIPRKACCDHRFRQRFRPRPCHRIRQKGMEGFDFRRQHGRSQRECPVGQ